MEVRSNSIGGTPPERLRVDITKPIRDVLKKSVPEIPPESITEDEATNQQRLLNARELEQTQKAHRIANARDEQSAKLAQRIHNAREEAMADRIQNARIERTERVANAREVEAQQKAQRISHAREEASADKLDISSAMQGLGESEEDARRVAELKQRLLEGSLHSDERIERAADKLLRGE